MTSKPVEVIEQERAEALKVARGALQREAFSRAVLDGVAAGICVCHDVPEFPYVCFTVWNGRMSELTGYSIEEINRAGWYQTVYPDPLVQARAKARMDRMRHGDNLLREPWTITRADGEARTIEISSSVLWAEDGSAHVLAFMEDVTDREREREERARLRELLERQQRLEAVGSLAAGVAHDFNNILAIILASAEITKKRLSSGKPAEVHVERIIAAIERGRQLVQQVLTFSRESEETREIVDPEVLVRETLAMLRGVLPTTVDIAFVVDPGCGVLSADPTQLQQVLVNLASNGAHAMRQDGGKLSIRLAPMHVDEAQAQRSPPLHAGEYVLLSVADEGHGMDERTLSRVFDPYFSTKGREEGTGLGLAVAHGIVTRHGGTITATSTPGKGSRFEILLPRHVDDQPETDEGADSRGRLLIVDDEPALAQVLQEGLADEGYAVDAVTSSVEALAWIKADPHRYDLVLTDQTMPGLTGEQLARELFQLRPSLPVILCSGYSESSSRATAVPSIRVVLAKPIAPSAIADAVRRVLESDSD